MDDVETGASCSITGSGAKVLLFANYRRSCYGWHMNSEGKGFYGLGIAPGILSTLDQLGFTVPTPIQAQSIPIAIEGKDLMGIAQTGTGKTLAFGIPVIQQVLQKNGSGLIIAPTRELALQIGESLAKVSTILGVRIATLIGGEPMWRQFRALERKPQIVVGTPGRILDHVNQKSLNLTKISMLVLDEADRMLDMGFAPQLRKIVNVLPKERQTMLFSATMPEEIVSLARQYLNTPLRVEIAQQGTTAKNVTQEVFFVPQELKLSLLEKVLNEYKGSVLVFARTKHAAKKITTHVRFLKHTAAEIHSNRSLSQRREALDGFKTGRYRVLVATDIASRGIDVTGIELVINYDLPQASADYVHRIGRTGRAGGSGHAISFARPDERNDVRAIERLTRAVLPVSQLPALNPPPRPPKPILPQPAHHARPAAPGAHPQRRPQQRRRPHWSPRPPRRDGFRG